MANMARRHPSEEHRLIESLKPLVNAGSNPHYLLGIGDDAAIRACAGEKLILTADSQIEGTHFSLDYMSIPEVGYRAMAVNLSDCAAMGAKPDGAVVQVVFPKTLETPNASIRKLYRGILRACRRWDFPIVGGDIAGGPCWMIAVTLLGALVGEAKPRTRKGALAGDGLWVTGRPGESAAGRAALVKWGRCGISRRFRGHAARHVTPQPRLELGRALAGDHRVHTMIDVSDGISKECRTLAFENSLAILLDAGAFPLTPSLKALAAELSIDPCDWFLHGGEDYELLFAASPDYVPAKGAEVAVTMIGRFVAGKPKVVLSDHRSGTRAVPNAGWDHARKRLPASQ
ncbi:MAG: thiamine-phosphate kinase [Chitinivibrionales bacterium]|nr:thiamine-phosphate kinase [Chitinivibrionales bacterium]MBD3357534.1 thiamine-phosphate kinase [Chitinivibrionales bacterium]